jgi:choline monooxygenase
VVAIDPVDVEHSTITIYSMVRPDVVDRDVSDEPNVVGAGSLIERGLVEDNEMSEGVQRGLHSGANAFVEFGRHESAAGHFHSNLDERLARMGDR